MRVAYDVSVLGRGYLDPRSRTGVFRAAESLLLELANRKEIDLSCIAFNGSQDFWDDTLVSQYFLNSSGQNFQHSSIYSSRLGLNSFYGHLSGLQRRYITFSQRRSLLLYKLVYLSKKAILPLLKLDLQLEFRPDNYQIYHSPFFPLPDQDRTGKLPRMLTVYDLIPVLFPNFMSRGIRQKFINTIRSVDLSRDWVICDSQNTRNDLCEYTGISPDRVFVTPLAANNYFFPEEDKDVIADTLRKHSIPNARYLLSVCTLEPRKNLSHLIRCFFKVVAENPSVELNLVLAGGIGWKNSAFFKQLFEANPILRSRVILPGYVPDADLSAIYSGAAAFVYPSLYEGFGLPPLEAMQCGTPVITSNTSSLPEVVGDAGIMIAPTDEDALCQAILALIQDCTLQSTLSQKGIERAKQFSWARCAEETVQAYQTAVANS